VVCRPDSPAGSQHRVETEGWIHTHTHARTHSRTLTRTHARTPTHQHTHSHTHTITHTIIVEKKGRERQTHRVIGERERHSFKASSHIVLDPIVPVFMAWQIIKQS